MQRTLALISAAWICSRETEGQPSPSCAVEKQRLSGQHTVELLDLLSRITSSKKIKVDKQETNWNEIWMSLPSIHPLEYNCLGLAVPIPQNTQDDKSVLHCVMFKRLISAWPKETLIKEALLLNHQFSRGHLAGRSRPTASRSGFAECRPNSGTLFLCFLCCYQTLFIQLPGCFSKQQKLISPFPFIHTLVW